MRRATLSGMGTVLQSPREKQDLMWSQWVTKLQSQISLHTSSLGGWPGTSHCGVRPDLF